MKKDFCVVKIGGKEISYFLKVNKRSKRIILKVKNDGVVEVVVPNRLSVLQVPSFLKAKKDWIFEKLNSVAKPFFVEDGAELSLFGENYFLVFHFWDKKRVVIRESVSFIDGKEVFEIVLFLPRNVLQDVIKNALKKFLRKKIKMYFSERVPVLAKKMGVSYNQFFVKEHISRWGSCSSKKNLNFNWKLIFFEPKVIDSVIVHELAHLRYMNHKKEFYDFVLRFCPDYKDLHKILKEKRLVLF